MADKDISNQSNGRGFHMGSAATNPNISEGTISRRILAYVIDIFILSLAVPISWFMGIASFGLLIPLLTFILVILPLAYHSLMIASSGSATIGQRIMGLKVVSQNGQKVEILQAVILTALFYASLTFTGGIILIWCLFDDKQRCLHDILAGTQMVHIKN